MNKVLYIILISLFSLTVISCNSSDSGSSTTPTTSEDNTTTPTTSTSQTFVDANFCRLTKNTSNRNSSLIVNERKSDSRSSKRTGRVKYVDKSALSQYQTDNYLLLDQFDLDSELGIDAVHLTNNPPDIGNNFTVELRFQFDDGGYDGGGKLIGSASDKAPKIEFRDHGKQIRYGFGGKTRDFAAVDKPDSVNLENWHHIATTFDGTNYKLYLDGIEINNSTAFSGLTPPEPITMIGNNLEGKTVLRWLGKVDEVRIWNDTRTQGEIQANMNKTMVGNEAGLVAYYPMDVNNNWEIIDKTNNANHAKIINAEILPRFFDNSSCTNGPDGTTTCPYPTIRSALDNVTSGDHVYIRQGRYTELLNKYTLNVDLAGHRGFSRSSYHESGVGIEDAFVKEEDRIIFEGYPGEEVIIDGTV
ncbi:MAG: LamG domain-containing protein, partial [Candidatus Marinimicrobia bacterium]|nr:LamG domain-containing protein [Candidatus Neomarinimicrobiota bacterium]